MSDQGQKAATPSFLGSVGRVVGGIIVLCVFAPGLVHSLFGNGGDQISAKVNDAVSSVTNNVVNTQCHVNLSSFSKVQTGMTYADVVRIFGCEGNEESRSDMAGYSTVMYAWDGSGTLGANMNAMFQNNHLTMKSQFGLR